MILSIFRNKLAMNEHHSNNRKIDPLKSLLLDDNTPNDKNRVEIGPTLLARREWEAAGLELPDLQAMREFRWKRLTQHIVDRDYGGLLMFDPLNIRYATDSTICSSGIRIIHSEQYYYARMDIWSYGIIKTLLFYLNLTHW